MLIAKKLCGSAGHTRWELPISVDLSSRDEQPTLPRTERRCDLDTIDHAGWEPRLHLLQPYWRTDAQREVGGVQRRGDRDHHHRHGAGDESAAGRHRASVAACAARFSHLYPEFRLCWHLLEQSPSHAPYLLLV